MANKDNDTGRVVKFYILTDKKKLYLHVTTLILKDNIS